MLIDAQNIKMENFNLKGADLSYVDFTNASFKNSNLEGVDLTGSLLLNVNLENTNLSKATLTNAVFKNVNLKNTNLDEVYLFNTKIEWETIDNASDIVKRIPKISNLTKQDRKEILDFAIKRSKEIFRSCPSESGVD